MCLQNDKRSVNKSGSDALIDMYMFCLCSLKIASPIFNAHLKFTSSKCSVF